MAVAGDRHVTERQMGTTTTFNIQERSLDFTVRVVRLCDSLQHSRGVPAREISKQLFRCAASIGANLHEANAAESRSDFIHKVAIAHKEAHETVYWLRVVERAGVLPVDRLKEITQESKELVAILTAIVRNARNNRTPANDRH